MKRFALAPLFAVLAAAQAEASVATFTDLAAWQAAAGSTILEDFSTSPAGNLVPGSTDIGAFSIFIDKNTPDPNGNVRNFIGNERFVGYQDQPGGINVGALVIRFDFDTAITAFAGSWVSTANGDNLTVLIDGNVIPFDTFLGTPGDGFLGFVSTNPFTSLLFGLEFASASIDGEAFALDNARLSGRVSVDVPEPAAALLLLGGIAGLLSCRRARA